MDSCETEFVPEVTSMRPLNPEEFRKQGHMIIDFLADYYQNIENYPVLSHVEPGYLKKRLPDSAPYHPEPIENILQDVQDHIIPGITHWQSPNFFAYFPCCASTAGFLGEILSSGFNIVAFNWMVSPSATELENIVMDWVGKLLKLPKSFLFSGGGGGVLLGSTCEAVLCSLITARDQKLSQVGRDNINKLVVYGSDQMHSTFQKAARLAGINPANIRSIKTTKSTLFALSPISLQSAIESDLQSGLIPLFLCATVGTTSTTAMDPLGPLSEIARDFGMWMHVDAAYAGSACICPEFRHFMDGIEGVDSLTFNPHKWFFTNLDCCCFWVKNPDALTKSLSSYPEYLRNAATESKKVVDYKDWQISLCKMFRALKLWLVLRSYGVANLRSFIKKGVDMAKLFANLVTKDNRFEIFTPRNLSLVCFRIAPAAITMPQEHESPNENDTINTLNQKLLASINASGQVFMSHTIVGGVYVIRLAVGGSLTDDRHVVAAWKVVQENANKILYNYSASTSCLLNKSTSQ